MTDRKTVREEVVRQSVLPDETPVLPAVRSRAPARDVFGKWQPGQSANPGGRPKQTADYKLCRELAREFSAHNIERMRELAETTEDDRVQYMARTWLDEKAWGKARDYDPNEDRAPRLDLLKMSPEDRQKLRDLLGKYEKQQDIPQIEHKAIEDGQQDG
jgi:hypothetical protein